MDTQKSNAGHERLTALERCAVIVLGLYLAGVGLQAIVAGESTYANYLRMPVAAPVAFVIGIVLIVAGLALRR